MKPGQVLCTTNEIIVGSHIHTYTQSATGCSCNFRARGKTREQVENCRSKKHATKMSLFSAPFLSHNSYLWALTCFSFNIFTFPGTRSAFQLRFPRTPLAFPGDAAMHINQIAGALIWLSCLCECGERCWVRLPFDKQLPYLSRKRQIEEEAREKALSLAPIHSEKLSIH